MLAERMMSNKELSEMLGKAPATVSKWCVKILSEASIIKYDSGVFRM